jgi:hypothetical protein
MIQIPSAKLQYSKIQYCTRPVSLFKPSGNLAKTKFLVTRLSTQFKMYVFVTFNF